MHESERNRIRKDVRRFGLAAKDMEWAAEAVQALIEDRAPGSLHALEVGMVVCYARPFTTSDWLAPLGEGWLPEGEGDRRLHRALVDLRDQWAAHTDRASGRDVCDVGAMMGDADPLYAASWPAGIHREVSPRIWDLCESQRVRFIEERRRLEAQLPSD